MLPCPSVPPMHQCERRSWGERRCGVISPSRLEKRISAARAKLKQQYAPVDGLQLHPDVDLVPEMSEDEFAALLEDVNRRGVVKPLDLQDGTTIVLDGRSRLEAARRAGLVRVPVVAVELQGETPVSYMIRAALTRRHLSPSQKAILGAELEKRLAEPAKERARQGNARGGAKSARTRASKTKSPANLPETSPARNHHGEAREQAALAVGASARNIQTAKTVIDKAPDLAEQIKAGAITVHQAATEIKRREKREELQANAAKEPDPTISQWEIFTGDCLELFKTQWWDSFKQKPRLIFADPPYNSGVDYGNGSEADTLSPEKFVSWCAQWLAYCEATLTPDGSCWLLISDEFALEIGARFKHTFTLANWVIWYESFGVNCVGKFNRTKRHLFHGVKNPKTAIFNEDAVTRPSDRQTKYNDARANPSGKLLDDVWFDIPRLTGTASERMPDFPTQLPLALPRRIVRCAAMPGDLVLDPFCGSGTTGAAALEYGCMFAGFELNPDFAQKAELRLKGVTRCS